MFHNKPYIGALAIALLACGDSAQSGTSNQGPGSSNHDDDDDEDEGDEEDEGEEGDGDEESKGDGDSTKPDKSDLDAGPFTPDPDSLDDGGALQGSGSCCEEHSTPGCNNADLMVCVCEKDPACCSGKWGKQCTFIVEQKYCQPGVRECVCGSEEGQWMQTSCCETEWTSKCDSVAKIKCAAAPGCF